MRDLVLEDTAYFDFTTRAFATGVPTVLAGSPVLKVLEENNATPITAGVSVAVDRASVVGLNMATIVATAANGYEEGKAYSVYISTGTVGGVSVVGEKVAEFTIGVIPDAVWDEILTGATHNIATSAGRRLRGIQEFQGYEGGAVWIDTLNGATGTTNFEFGTVEQPVKTLAEANTIAASLNLHIFEIESGSTITLAAAQNNQVFRGINWTLALGGQDVAGTHFVGARVSGVMAGTGTTQIFERCLMSATSLIKGTHLIECGIAATLTVVEAGDFFFDRCHSAIAGTATWIFEFGNAIGNTNLNLRNYSGGVQLESMGDTGTDTASIEGRGQIIEGTCAGGAASVRGSFAISGQTNITFTEEANVNATNINAEVDTGLTDYGAATPADVASELVDALVNDIVAELTDALPGATAGIAAMVGALYDDWRNKTTTSAILKTLHNDAGTAVVKWTVGDAAGTSTKEEVVAQT